MEKIKKCDFAGTFYPKDENELNALIDSFTATNIKMPDKTRAIITPHAGYIYSGEVAVSAYQSIKTNDPITVILMAPTHNYSFDDIATSDHTAFETPFGLVNVDTTLRDKYLQLPQVNMVSQAFSPEHTFETQLPFIKKFLPNALIVPFISGNCSTYEISELFSNCDNTIIVSTDLSHFHPYDQAALIDNNTKDLILNYKYNELTNEMACGFRPVSGLLHWAKEHQYQITTLSLKNSGDTQGDKSSVVGYGSFAIYS